MSYAQGPFRNHYLLSVLSYTNYALVFQLSSQRIMHGSRCEPTVGIDPITSAAPTETNSSLQDTGISWNSCPNVHVFHGTLIVSLPSATESMNPP